MSNTKLVNEGGFLEEVHLINDALESHSQTPDGNDVDESPIVSVHQCHGVRAARCISWPARGG